MRGLAIQLTASDHMTHTRTHRVIILLSAIGLLSYTAAIVAGTPDQTELFIYSIFVASMLVFFCLVCASREHREKKG